MRAQTPVRAQLLVIAKAPVPGRVKTRLCPPCTPTQAAAVAAAALADTVATVTSTPAERRTMLLCGWLPTPPGWRMVAQRGDGLGLRLAHGFHDTALPGRASALIGMDTPQLTPALLTELTAGLRHSDAVLGPARDGGWWGLALCDPAHATVLARVPMSTPETADRTVEALRSRGLRVGFAATLRDVDTAADAWAVAAACRTGTFADAVAAHVPQPAGARR
jgi:glycosyltransferase A (GT-A) superfamily protein (DUF2064 family)